MNAARPAQRRGVSLAGSPETITERKFIRARMRRCDARQKSSRNQLVGHVFAVEAWNNPLGVRPAHHLNAWPAAGERADSGSARNPAGARRTAAAQLSAWYGE